MLGSNSALELGPGLAVQSMGTGEGFTCAIVNRSAAAKVYCFGDNSFGITGDLSGVTHSDTQPPSSSGPVFFGTGIYPLGLGVGSRHACILDNASRVRCWGSCVSNACGYSGPTNIGTASLAVAAAGAVNLGGYAVRALFVGFDHTAAVLATGSLVAWGSNTYGELGAFARDVDGANTGMHFMCTAPHCQLVGLGFGSSSEPSPPSLPYPACAVPLPTNRSVTSMCFGMSHSCILWDNGQVSCAGAAYSGQTGYGDTTTRSTQQSYASLPVIALPRNRTVVRLVCGDFFTLISLNDGTVRSFGEAAATLSDLSRSATLSLTSSICRL